MYVSVRVANGYNVGGLSISHPIAMFLMHLVERIEQRVRFDVGELRRLFRNIEVLFCLWKLSCWLSSKRAPRRTCSRTIRAG